MTKDIDVRTFRQRFVYPVATLLGIWLLATVLLAVGMNVSLQLDQQSLYKIVMNILSATRFLILLLGSLILYPIMFFRGASLSERLLGCYVIPIAYLVWAIIQATEYFPVGQAFYYGLNPVTVGTSLLQLGLIGLAETTSRWWYRKRSLASVRVLTWASVAGIVIGATGIYVTLFWEGGVHWFYVYKEVYSYLF